MKKLIISILALASLVMALDFEYKFSGYAGFETFLSMPNDGIDSTPDQASFGYNMAGANFTAKAESEKVKGTAQIGFSTAPQSVYLRLAVGEYLFTEDISILMGQTYGPVNTFPSSQVYGGGAGLLNMGGCYHGRRRMVQFQAHGFKLALLESGFNLRSFYKTGPNPSDKTNKMKYIKAKDIDDLEDEKKSLSAFVKKLEGSAEAKVPNPEIGYSFSAEENKWNVGFAAGFQTFNWTTNDTSVKVEDEIDPISSYVLMLEAGAKLGPVGLNLNVNLGQNWATYGMWTTGPSGPIGIVEDKEVEIANTSTLGMLFILNGSIGEALSPEFGFGYVSHKLGLKNTVADAAYTAYLQMGIKLGDNFSMTPEVGYENFLTEATTKPEKTNMYIGAFSSIRF